MNPTFKIQTADTQGVRIGIAQLENSPNWYNNYRRAISTINLFAKYKVNLLCFQEAFLSGYFASAIHKDFSRLEYYLGNIRSHAYEKNICVMMPTISRSKGDLYNSIFIYNSDKGDSTLHKKGLTKDETTIMKPGGGSRTFEVKGHKFGILMCREIEDKHYAYLERQSMPDMVLWPSAWATLYQESWTSESPQSREAYAKVAAYKVPMALINLSHHIQVKTGKLKQRGKSYCVSGDNKVVAVGAYGIPDGIVLQLKDKVLSKIGNI